MDRAYSYQVGRDAIGDARYDKEWEHQLEREAVGDAQREKEFAAAQAAVEFEKELALKEAKSAEEQQAGESGSTSCMRSCTVQTQPKRKRSKSVRLHLRRT